MHSAAHMIWLSALVCLMGSVQTNAGSDEQGKRLAAQYCKTCHVQPLPEHLDKATWISKVFPVMRTYMGMDSLVQRAQMTHDLAALYPTSPLMTEDEWFAIASWYVDNAPASLPAAEPIVQHGVSSVFEHLQIRQPDGPPMTSVTQFDTLNHQIVVGDAQTGVLRVLDLVGREVARVDVGGPPSCLVIKGNTWFVTNMGKLLPHDSAAGSLVQFRWSGKPGGSGSSFVRSVLIDSLRRPTNLVVSDINQDGIDDYLVTEYGNLLGRFGWYEIKKNGTKVYHELSPQPGAIRAIIRDVNNDRRPDIIVLLAQAKEVVRVYVNSGKGRFTSTDVVEMPPSYGSSSLRLKDIDGDGVEEIIVTAGDNGDYDAPPFKPYHGVYIYKRRKTLDYALMSFDRFDGAYGAIVEDFDMNGKHDMLSFSYFPRLTGLPTDVIRYTRDRTTFRDGVYAIPESLRGRWLVSDVADVDADGDVDVLLGNVSIGPGAVTDEQTDQWMSSGYQALFLKNSTK